ncbi:hypothetical protein [Clostridium kluyveri]|uniref:Phage-related protein n=2 Tax=Clostridium kluyveri TaxID=1534 RepID=A5N2A5_CLOK5|nr:hypothetical protein [Clostridium kluyveri]EDK35251.1 Conserved hypothetical protein [Clostridium kluyveri DSM 555]BAH07925.1 hypothetical protein CKR_2874 [Clostridium kluyveri NBRC 12016]
MAYPESIDKFTEKLNKLDNNTYVIEEEIQVTDGVYEGELQHDNVSLPSINVYTGSKLTGTKIENVIVSTPSLTPWKKTIKIFSSVSPVYISYQTQGDTVEAEDINKVQDSIVNTQKEVDRYKSSNDNRVTDAENRISTVENNKAEKTYVDTELNKRYLKSETYTKTETDQRIQMVVDAAPEALDTLKEIADSLNNDPDFAATITTALSKKVDKVDGKQLSAEDYTSEEKDKLAGIEDNANKYVHPTTHPGSMITEDGTHRWSTDTEKTNWNDANSKKHVHNNLELLQTITQALINAWNTVSDKSDVGHTHDDRYYTETESNNKFATKDEISNAGYGDMLKSVYDTNGNGIVDKAEDSNTVGGKSVNDFTKRVILTGQLQKTSYRRSVIALCELTNTNPRLNSYSTGIISFKRGNGITELTSLYVGAEKLYNSSTMHYFGLGLGRSPDLIRPCTFTYNGNVYGGIEFKFSNAESNQVEFNGSSTFNIFGLDYYDTQNNVPLNEEVDNSLNFDTTINKLPNLLYNNDKIALQKDVVPKGCTWNDLKGV